MSIRYLFCCFLFVGVFLPSCQRNNNKRFDIIGAAQSGITFDPLAKISDRKDDNNIKEFGNAVAIGDLNNDGKPDIIFSGFYAHPEIYLNRGALKFENITEKSGISTAKDFNAYGIAIIDINGDGWNDIYMCVNGSEAGSKSIHNLLYINNRNGSFSEQSAAYHLDIHANCYMPYFFDYDRDGDPDLFLLIWPHMDSNPFDLTYISKAKKDSLNFHSLLLENRNDTFVDVTVKSGLDHIPATNNSCIIGDINNDGWPDIYVANDFVFPDQLYINHEGHFANQLGDYVSKTSLFSMGTDLADINNDHFPDLIELDMLSPDHFRRKTNTLALTTSFYDMLKQQSFPQYQRNVLQLNNQGKNFSEISFLSNIYATEWSWSPLIADFDNDGWKDIFISSGSRKELTNLDYLSNYVNISGSYDPIKQWILDWKNIPSHKYHDFIFKNVNGLEFSDKTSNWGLTGTVNSEGAAYADLDGDGDLDIVVCNTNQTPFILRNNSKIREPFRNYIQISLHSENKYNFYQGTKVTLYAKRQEQYQEAITTRGYLSVSDGLLHFGLDTISAIDSIRIVWPSGKTEIKRSVKANQKLQVYEKDAKDISPDTSPPSVSAIERIYNIADFLHKEDNFDDFKRDKIIPHRVSRSGPVIAVADINKDGLQDFYITGAKNQRSALFIQQTNGTFKAIPIDGSVPNKDDEVAAIFADIDHDGFPDLITGIGSNASDGSDTSQHLSVYMNRGGIRFEKVDKMLPDIKFPISSICAADIDGEMEMFVACRIVPGSFGIIPSSYLLAYKNGGFTDITDKKAPELRHSGMLTGGTFADIDGDKKNELILCGEFMPISVFKNINKIWTNITQTSNLHLSNGLWNCITVTDINNDGNPDILAGNWGDNSIWRASLTEPLSLWVNDFDNNGSIDPVLFHYLNHVNAPFVNRDVFCKEMPFYFNRFNNYESYAKTAAKDFFPDAKNTSVLNAYTLHTSLFINDGKGHFELKELPTYFQIAPVNSFIVYDFDNNGTKDLMPLGNNAGNFYDQGDLDAMRGNIFGGDAKGNFKKRTPVEAMNQKSVINSGTMIYNNFLKKNMILLGVNNDSLQVYIINGALK